MPLIDMLLPQFDRELGTTRRLLEVVPEAALPWAPGAGTRTAAELTAHLADIPAWTRAIMDAAGHDLAALPPARPPAHPPGGALEAPGPDVAATRDPAPVTSVAAGLERFDAGVATGRAALAGRSDDELVGDWTLSQRGRVLFSVPRIAAVQALVLNHVVHHRGQLSVYLRLRGVRVPPIYGPAADDPQTAARPRR